MTSQLYDEAPSTGGTLLRQAVFVPLEDDFAGSTFAPISLVAGTPYFVGFRDVTGLGVNYTNDLGATSLGQLYFGNNADGMYDQPATGMSAQPILKFLGPQGTIPEPGTLGLGVLGGALGGLLRWNRRRSAI